MADKTVGELPRASTVTSTDLFVMEQSGQAKSLTGQVLIHDLATALDGHGGIKSIALNDDYTLTFTLADDTEVTTSSTRGAKGEKGDRGTDGRAITSVTKTGTSGLVDTYKIQFSDNTSTTFTVTNGSSIKTIAKTGTSGLMDTYKVTLTDNTSSTFTVTNGNGIASISLQSGTHAAGTTDVYKIAFDNGQYTTFSVYNGLNGSGSVVSVNGVSPDASGNVALTASSVGAPTTEQFTSLQTTVNGKQPATNSLTAETAIADADYFPFYDASAKANRKTLWSSIMTAIRAAFAKTPLPIASGGTGAATAAAARTNLGVPTALDVYPVGSVYMSVSETSPASLFGGTWEQIKDTFLLAAGDTYTAGSTGGEPTHTLIIKEMPSHSHIRALDVTYGQPQVEVRQWDWMCSADTFYQNSTEETIKRLGFGGNSTGDGAAHNNMPPYVVIYMWKRVA